MTLWHVRIASLEANCGDDSHDKICIAKIAGPKADSLIIDFDIGRNGYRIKMSGHEIAFVPAHLGDTTSSESPTAKDRGAEYAIAEANELLAKVEEFKKMLQDRVASLAEPSVISGDEDGWIDEGSTETKEQQPPFPKSDHFPCPRLPPHLPEVNVSNPNGSNTKTLTKHERMLATGDWVPVLRGKIYCSPACGLGCTKRDYDKAVAGAAKLLKRLGPKWSSEVWENFGWHYKVTSGPVSIYSHTVQVDDKTFNCFISDDVESPVGGSAIWTVHGFDRDPIVAGRIQLDSAIENVNRLLQAVFSGGSALDLSPDEVWQRLLPNLPLPSPSVIAELRHPPFRQRRK